MRQAQLLEVEAYFDTFQGQSARKVLDQRDYWALKYLMFATIRLLEKYLTRTSASFECSLDTGLPSNTLQQSIHSTLQIIMGNFDSGIAGGVFFTSKLEPQIYSLLE